MPCGTDRHISKAKRNKVSKRSNVKSKKIFTATGWTHDAGFQMLESRTKKGLIKKVNKYDWRGKPTIRGKTGKVMDIKVR